jgi:hypothetical protein
MKGIATFLLILFVNLQSYGQDILESIPANSA